MITSKDFETATSFSCGSAQSNAEQPKETTLVAAMGELASGNLATRTTKQVDKIPPLRQGGR